MKSVFVFIIACCASIISCSNTPVDEPELRIDFNNHFVSGLFSNLGQKKFDSGSHYLKQLITENRFNIDKQNTDIHSTLYNNIIADSYINLASNTGHYLQNTINNLLSKSMQSDDIKHVEIMIDQSISILTQTFRVFAYQAAVIWNDRERLDEHVKAMTDDIKININSLAEKIIEFIPKSRAIEFDQVLGILESMFDFWTKSLAGSLGPYQLE